MPVPVPALLRRSCLLMCSSVHSRKKVVAEVIVGDEEKTPASASDAGSGSGSGSGGLRVAPMPVPMDLEVPQALGSLPAASSLLMLLCLHRRGCR